MAAPAPNTEYYKNDINLTLWVRLAELLEDYGEERFRVVVAAILNRADGLEDNNI